jgi:UDP-glucose 4-epimerase
MFDGKRVLVTGGTGSMGRVLVRRILSGEQGVPAKVIVLSRDDAKQYDMRIAYMNRSVATDDVTYRNFERALEFRIGDVRRYADVVSAMRDSDIVINAAALKQVPTCEYFPMQAVLTNCVGAENLTRAIIEHRMPIEAVVGISTDKAALPINVMGMTKAVQERIFIAANIHAPQTRFVCVRYGNVMASRGSVIPLFRQQVLGKSPITITTEDMTRFMLSIDQAVDTVFAALKDAKRGEVLVPDAPSSKMTDVAKAMIGDHGNEIRVVGIRPGEKVHEVMISQEECHHVRKAGNYYAILPMLPELQDKSASAPSARNRELSSADSLLNFEGTRALLEKHKLLPDQDSVPFDSKY